MKLPFLSNFKKKVISTYFLVLILRNEKAHAVIFEESMGKVKIIGQHNEYFSNNIEEANTEEFLEVLDKAISQAESSLPQDIQTQKTIFGVKENWSENNQIKKEYLIKLKKACEQLSLTPIGFLVISQAISHRLQKEEGAPISAILVEINNKSVTVNLVRGGKTVETQTSQIHESIPFTVDTLLKHFKASEILPSRIILFDGKEDLSQEFIGHVWSKSLPFLHIPQITNLPEGFDAKAVLSGAATQMGFEVLGEDMPVINETPATTETQNKDETLKPELSASEEFSDSVDTGFGFVKDKDVAKMPEEIIEETSEKSGVTRPSDNAAGLPAKDLHKKTNNLLSLFTVFIGHGLRILKRIDFRKYLSFLPLRKGKMSIVIPGILLLTLAVLLSYFLFLKATVVISVEPKITEKNLDILFSTILPSDLSKNIIKGEFVNISEKGSVATTATGKKDLGEKAKGTVTIFNSQSQARTLASGSTIKSPNNLAFTLDRDVTIKGVASHSADEIVTPEKTNVNVTGENIGKEYNLPSGTKFTVSSFDITDLVAKNDNPFSGGSKKEVTVISSKDNEKLEEELPKKLETKAIENLSQKLSKDKILLPVFVETVLKEKKLDGKIGDEKNNVTLEGVVEYQGISYDRSDLVSFAKSLLEKAITSDQKIDYSNIKTSVKNIKRKNDKEINSTLTIKALLLPNIDEKNLQREINGLSFTKAEDILYKLPQITNIDISFSPQIPFLPKKLPVMENNIKFLIKIEG